MASIEETETNETQQTCVETKPRLPSRHYRYRIDKDQQIRLPRIEGDNGMNTCEVCGKPCSTGASACRACIALIGMRKDAQWDHERVYRDYMVFGYHDGVHWD
jgi:hypothetical protein